MKAVACWQPVLTTQAVTTAEAMTITAMAAGMMIMDTAVTGTTIMVMAVGMTTMDTVAGMMTTAMAAVTGTTDIP